MTIYKINPDNEVSSYWDVEPSSNKEVEALKETDGFKRLSKGLQDAAVGELAGSEAIVKPSVALIEELTDFMNFQNLRVRASYKARKEAIIAELQGKVADEQVAMTRKAADLSAEQLKQNITKGTIKVGNATVSDGVPVEGVELSTIAYLDALIKKGKDDAANRRAKAVANKAAKGGE